MAAVGKRSRFGYFKALMLCFAESLKKIFSGHHFIFLTFLKKMNLKHCITLIVTKKGLLSIDLYLRFRP